MQETEKQIKTEAGEQTGSLGKTAFVAVISILLVLALMGTATYAWFTSHQSPLVSTGTASGKSGTSSMALLIGPDEGELVDSSTEEVSIKQVNDAKLDNLQPVSTADLETYHYPSAYTEGKASSFAKATTESRIYHGKLYLRMDAPNVEGETTYKLYLDTAEDAGGKIGQSTSGYLLNGARLGLKFEGGEPIILKFDQDSKGTAENNTMISGRTIENGQVLNANGEPVADPAVDFSKYCVDSSSPEIEIPEEAIATLTVNQTLGLDVYFYLEGCDEDCNGEIAKNEAEFHLAFYAVADSNS